MKGRIRTCYISATPGANLDVLGEVLRDRGIATARASSVLAGASLDHEVLEALQNVDVVIGVISSERRSQWVLYELGQARALGKQILLFAPPKSALTAPDLSRFLIVRAGIRNREAVAFAVDQLLAAPERLVQRQQSSGSARAGLGARVNDLLVELRSILSTRDALGLEKFVARIIQEAGVEVIAERLGRRDGADLAIWADELQPFLGNPLLVEIKLELSSTQQTKSALQQLAGAVATSGTMWGLLIYASEAGAQRRALPAAPANILVISVAELLESMRQRSFADVVRGLRDRRVHGIAD